MRRVTIPILMAVAMVWGCDANPAPTDGGDPSGDSGTVDAGPNTGVDGGPQIDGGPTCIDVDSDGYGEGCASGADCNDNDNGVSPAATEVCDGQDNNCDGEIDEDFIPPSCGLSEGVCAGSTAGCGPTGVLDCSATNYGSDYEADETSCDGMDNDCDGTTDEGCSCTDEATQACGSAIGVCAEGTQTCASSAWGICEGETAPMGEVCDGLDNDCDGDSDEAGDLTPPACPLQLGVCAGSERSCGGASGWIACTGTASYGGDYQVAETLCDGLDNNCDGITDEGCACTDGTSQPCGSDVGVCMAGVQTCTAGAWGGCAGEIAPGDEACNGIDDNCDGGVDEDLFGDACALTEGVCAGSTQSCGGASGFATCTATEYGSRYEADESSCDGFDNDCDGVTDEDCECVDGSTQACGSGLGVCERGLQTCISGAWSDCAGEVTGSDEICNGLDDNCDGSSDEGVSATAAPCALTEGVCADSVQTCAGVDGWTSCAGTDSYGPNYVATEDGSADESVCDGLDNDCNGTVDDGCTSGPLIRSDVDMAWPDIDNQHLVYGQRIDTSFDIVLVNIRTGTQLRLTTTDDEESLPRVSGNYVAFLRGPAEDGRVVIHNIATSTETVISTAASSYPSISGSLVAYAEVQTDGQADIMIYDLTTDVATNVTNTSGFNEIEPNIRAANLVYTSDEGGVQTTNYMDVSAATFTPVPQTGTAIQTAPVVDYAYIGWTDARNATLDPGNPQPTDNWDVFGAPLEGAGSDPFPGDRAVAQAPSPQITRDVSAPIFLIDDYQNGDWNVAVAGLDGNVFPITSDVSTQAFGSMSGGLIVWMDNRLGNYVIYASSVGASFAAAPIEGSLLINEILADPPAGADVNGDGNPDTTEDEFVEIRNWAAQAIDMSGVTLSDDTGVQYTFADGTVLPAGGTFVVFGGGSVPALLGGAQAGVATGLSLNNTGDTLTLTLGTTVIDTITYGSEGGHDESLERVSVDTLTRHSMIPESVVAPYTPGISPFGWGY